MKHHWAVLADVKGIFHIKMKILWLFTRPHAVLNLYDFLSSTDHKRKSVFLMFFPHAVTVNGDWSFQALYKDSKAT